MTPVLPTSTPAPRKGASNALDALSRESETIGDPIKRGEGRLPKSEWASNECPPKLSATNTDHGDQNRGPAATGESEKEYAAAGTPGTATPTASLAVYQGSVLSSDSGRPIVSTLAERPLSGVKFTVPKNETPTDVQSPPWSPGAVSRDESRHDPIFRNVDSVFGKSLLASRERAYPINFDDDTGSEKSLPVRSDNDDGVIQGQAQAARETQGLKGAQPPADADSGGSVQKGKLNKKEHEGV